MSKTIERRNPTLADVADRAGVSRSLASLALRGDPGVLPEKRARILRAAAELNYRPNPLARDLASRETRTVGVVVGDITNPFLAVLAREIDSLARARGYDVLLSINGAPDEAARASVEGLLAQRVAGVVLVGAPTSDAAIRAIAGLLPVAYVGRHLATLEVDSVSTDDFFGATLAVEHLVGAGHGRIAHVDGGTGAGARRRREGYASAMGRCGLEPRIVPGSYSIDAGAEAAREPMRSDAAPTAIFAANDLVALGVMNHLARSGLSVPGDVAVVGYDDMPLAATETVSLTTVRQPIARLAEEGLESLVRRVKAPAEAVRRALISPELVTRRSTGRTPA